MKIIVVLSNDEANRQIEAEDENIRPAHIQVIREIENILCSHQIRYESIEVEDD